MPTKEVIVCFYNCCISVELDGNLKLSDSKVNDSIEKAIKKKLSPLCEIPKEWSINVGCAVPYNPRSPPSLKELSDSPTHFMVEIRDSNNRDMLEHFVVALKAAEVTKSLAKKEQKIKENIVESDVVRMFQEEMKNRYEEFNNRYEEFNKKLQKLTDELRQRDEEAKRRDEEFRKLFEDLGYKSKRFDSVTLGTMYYLFADKLTEYCHQDTGAQIASNTIFGNEVNEAIDQWRSKKLAEFGLDMTTMNSLHSFKEQRDHILHRLDREQVARTIVSQHPEKQAAWIKIYKVLFSNADDLKFLTEMLKHV